MKTIYNDGRVAIMLLNDGNIRIDTRNFVFGTNDPDGTIDSVTVPRKVLNKIDFSYGSFNSFNGPEEVA
tara:strand:- start:1083 stop:1289 length:207 start_codon:yes stop_codon:yes gene_type:complete